MLMRAYLQAIGEGGRRRGARSEYSAVTDSLRHKRDALEEAAHAKALAVSLSRPA